MDQLSKLIRKEISLKFLSWMLSLLFMIFIRAVLYCLECV